MAALCRTRFRYIRLFAHPVGDDALRRTGIYLSLLSWSGGSRPVYPCYRFGVGSLISIQGFNIDDFSSRARVLRGTCTPNCHQQCRANSGKEATIMMCRRLTLAALLVFKWSKDLDVIFIMFGVLCILVNS
jgi:hypothetical protein